MLRHFRLIKSLFTLSPWEIFKGILWGLLFNKTGINIATFLRASFLVWLMWNSFLKRPIYQRLYGIPNPNKLQIIDADIFEDFVETPPLFLNINGYKIEIYLKKIFRTTSRVAGINKYNFLGTFYRSTEYAKLFDNVSPQDIFLMTGKSGNHPECFDFEHNYRGLSWSYLPCEDVILENSIKDISNNHVITASINVQHGLDILKKGDIIQIEGYAIYWNGTEKLSNYTFESALGLNDESNAIVYGKKTKLTRQLLITKITFDGYTFE